jgi:predicted porin
MKIQKSLLFAGLLFPAVCLADASNYNYVEGNFLQGEIADTDVDGWGAEASFRFVDRAFLIGKYQTLELDESIPGLRLEGRSTQLGLGYVFGENETATVYGTASYMKAEFRSRFNGVRFDDDADGYEIAAGVRINLGPQTELNASVAHYDLDGNSDTVPKVGLVYKFTSNFAGTVNYSWNSDDNTLGLGLRFYF